MSATDEHKEKLKAVLDRRLGHSFGIDADGIAQELGAGERPLEAIKAKAENDVTAGVLLLTDRRLLFRKKGIVKQRRESLPLTQIQVIEITGLMTKKLEIKAGGRTLKYSADTLMSENLNPKDFVCGSPARDGRSARRRARACPPGGPKHGRERRRRRRSDRATGAPRGASRARRPNRRRVRRRETPTARYVARSRPARDCVRLGYHD
jgi:Bacterial PH domain